MRCKDAGGLRVRRRRGWRVPRRRCRWRERRPCPGPRGAGDRWLPEDQAWEGQASCGPGSAWLQDLSWILGVASGQAGAEAGEGAPASVRGGPLCDPVSRRGGGGGPPLLRLNTSLSLPAVSRRVMGTPAGVCNVCQKHLMYGAHFGQPEAPMKGPHEPLQGSEASGQGPRSGRC